MAEPSERLESDRLDSIRLFQDSVHWEGKVFDVLIKNGCSKEDLVNVSSMLQTIYMCGFEVGKRCVKERKCCLAIETSWNLVFLKKPHTRC